MRVPFRAALVATGLVVVAALAACSTGPAGGDGAAGAGATTSTSAEAGAFPVTIRTHFGPVTITRQPTRVVTLGTSDPDNLLALGVVPVGVTKVSWGGNAKGSTPWFDARLAKLGASMPTQYSDSDSIPYTDVAALDPDVILATNSGLTRQQYDTLSKIAPVVAYPGDAWTTTWQQSLIMDGKAVGRLALARRVEARTESELASAKKRFPGIQGKTFIFAALETSDLSSISYYTPADSRPTFLTEIGMRNAPSIVKIAPKGAFYGQVSAERGAQLRSDVLVTYSVKASDAKTFTDDTLIGQIPAIKSGHLLTVPEGPTALSATIPTPLSIPYALKHFVPQVAKAVAGRSAAK